LTKAPEHHQATNPGLLRGEKKQLYISTEVHARRGQPEADEDVFRFPNPLAFGRASEAGNLTNNMVLMYLWLTHN